MKLWLFGTYKWQGNPKALFLYMSLNRNETHECWWIADKQDEADIVQQLGFKATYLGSTEAKYLFSHCDVYVTENFREVYPSELSDTAKIFNTWHGVGLKHIELAVDSKSIISTSVVRKNIKNFKIYTNNMVFLATSAAMEEHFLEDTLLNKYQMIKGVYPRNLVYKDEEISTFNVSNSLNVDVRSYNSIILFCPTWRVRAINGVFQYLLPNLEALERRLVINNNLCIIKVHPSMTTDPYYVECKEKYKYSQNILFWNDEYDIYEFFSKIDVAIVDYSSIFYDLLDAGVDKFIRYIPDYEEYTTDSELIGDYFSLTGGDICYSFVELLDKLDHPIKEIDNKNELLDYFFGYRNESTIDEMIQKVDDFVVENKVYPELHTFDVFDTLIRRKTLTPMSVFYYVADQARVSGLDYPSYLLENWPKIRNQVEHDVRDMFRKTQFERNTDAIEITFDEIYNRLRDHMNLSLVQVDFLKEAEIQAEIDHVEAIPSRIDYMLAQQQLGHDIALISDMYLPEAVIRAMLHQADPRMDDIPLYLSATIGHQKSTGKLYKHIFFEKKYAYQRWVHYGDNKHADGKVPRQLGIQTIVHDIDAFIPYEGAWIQSVSTSMRYDAYRLATAMQRYRSSLVHHYSNELLEKYYYAFAYAGAAIVPYVNWAIKDALKRGYETIYFISRDGHFLKLVADEIIKQRQYNLKTHYIYGSRKAWRIPSFIHEVDPETFEPFGSFTGMDAFEDLVKASWLSRNELLRIFPQFETLKNEPHLRGDIAVSIRKTMSESVEYKNRILEIAAEKRPIVKQYLQQEIDFSEKFAFIEFWGRGYTQDTFSRLLCDAAERDVSNPFYYVRSFSHNIGQSLRHNFIQAPLNFMVFEPIFAATPYESIAGYREAADGRIEPVIHEQPNDIAEIMAQGLVDFAKTYANLNVEDEDNFDRSLATFAYDYQMKTFNDQFICSVFGSLTDNVSSYGDVKEYAPALSLDQIRSVQDKKDLDVITNSIHISLARSAEAVRRTYQQIFKAKKLPTSNPPPIKKVYAVNDLSKYVNIEQVPCKIVTLKPQAYMMDVSWNEESKRTDLRAKALEIIEVENIDWTKSGIPRLLTKNGYLTASAEWVQRFEDAVGAVIYPAPDGDYKLIPSEIKKKYYTKLPDDGLFILKKRQRIYADINFKKESRTQFYYDQLDAFKADNIVWSDSGVPRIAVHGGYISANKANVTSLANIQKVDMTESGLTQSNHVTQLNDSLVFVQFSLNESLDVAVLKAHDQKIRDDIENYYVVLPTHRAFKSKSKLNIYKSTTFNESQLSGKSIKKGVDFQVDDIVWTKGGTPRLKVEGGYVSANRKVVSLDAEYIYALNESENDSEAIPTIQSDVPAINMSGNPP